MNKVMIPVDQEVKGEVVYQDHEVKVVALESPSSKEEKLGLIESLATLSGVVYEKDSRLPEVVGKYKKIMEEV